ncbi:hypothetical protein Sgou_42660 [Streptomyces gougerotii]|uniref:Uncharacterized protein n=1 Tax=Streptomyces gougerotii TaxID=53448 RepID=A0ABQ1DAX1_9ACTN|nr:hypothetical protein Srut_54760 [Streptomyces rutgersensis]GFH79596.1 hypothetical protein Sgou_42660 [Streptomyces gougerotii]GGU24609.1 hypothetical protein GCM10015534_29000 [Streptomyces diastaticus subsp. diastaticus]
MSVGLWTVEEFDDVEYVLEHCGSLVRSGAVLRGLIAEAVRRWVRLSPASPGTQPLLYMREADAPGVECRA